MSFSRPLCTAVERETLPFDVCIVGAGPAGLSAAIRLKQLAKEENREVSVAVLEKGSEVGMMLWFFIPCSDRTTDHSKQMRQ